LGVQFTGNITMKKLLLLVGIAALVAAIMPISHSQTGGVTLGKIQTTHSVKYAVVETPGHNWFVEDVK